MRVMLEHSQRRPAADVLDDAQRDPRRNHRGRAGVTEDVMRDAFQANRAHQTTEGDADRFLPRRLAHFALAEDVAALVRVGDERGPQLWRHRYAPGLAVLRLHDRRVIRPEVLDPK